MTDAIRLRCGGSQATISPKGAELVQWSVGETEILYPGDSPAWRQSCPLMFPACGWSNNSTALIGGRQYHMPVHGFISHQKFDVVSRSESSLSLESRSNNVTRAIYPFSYLFSINYVIDQHSLCISCTVTNESDEHLDYAIGIHPGFRWPLVPSSKESWRLEFSEAECPVVPIVTASGLLSREMKSVPLVERSLPLTDALFADEALCFLNTRSTQVSLIGHHRELRVTCRDARHWTIWSIVGENFLTLEPSTGHGDYAGPLIPFHERRGMTRLEAGKAKGFSVTFDLRTA
ncbi:MULTISPECIES: hypothetical protein [Agrobacterium]